MTEPDVAGARSKPEPASTGAASAAQLSGYSRVLLKLGGEMFGGGQVGLDPDVVAQVARQIADVVRGGVQIAVVIGGGNFSGAHSCSSSVWSAPGRTIWECSALS
ncbi:hypothetical protein EH33_02770 [Mycobacterium tuberculosis]|nr:hypothetical protein EH33_02770 [Mycobacterium tuberculosis]